MFNFSKMAWGIILAAIILATPFFLHQTEKLPNSPDLVASSVLDSVVEISGEKTYPDPKDNTKTKTSIALGSGYFVTDDGYIVTNYHVINGLQNIEVLLHDGVVAAGRVIGGDPNADIAIVKIRSFRKFKPVNFGNSDRINFGDYVISIGSPVGLDFTVTTGIISNPQRPNVNPLYPMIQTDAAINRGNSGGPLFDNHFRLIGMNTEIFSTSGGSIGLGFAIPSNYVYDIASKLINQKEITRSLIGAALAPYTDDDRIPSVSFPTNWTVVMGTEDDSPARLAGLRSDDVITSIDGLSLPSQAMRYYIINKPTGTNLKFTILRDYKTELKISIKTGPLPVKDPVDKDGGDNQDNSKK